VIEAVMRPVLWLVGVVLLSVIMPILVASLVVEVTVIRFCIDIYMRIKNGRSKKVKEEATAE
jgi:hypothetical protein